MRTLSFLYVPRLDEREPSLPHPIRFGLGLVAIGLSLLSATLAVRAAPTNPALLQEDFPFQGACIGAQFPDHNVALKGLAIRIGNGASVLFDTELLRIAAGSRTIHPDG